MFESDKFARIKVFFFLMDARPRSLFNVLHSRKHDIMDRVQKLRNSEKKRIESRKKKQEYLHREHLEKVRRRRRSSSLLNAQSVIQSFWKFTKQ